MKNLNSLLVFIIAAAILLISCQNKNDKESIRHINTMLEDCASMKINLNDTFLDSVNKYIDSAQISLAFFMDNEIDSFPMEKQDLMQAYYHMLSVEKMLKNYTSKHLPVLNEDIELLSKQLTDLKHDIKHSLIEEEIKLSYLEAEDSAYNFLSKISQDRIEHIRAHFVKYTENKNKVEELKHLFE